MLTRHIRESLQVTPGPFPDFWVGPGDEARLSLPIAYSFLPYVGGRLFMRRRNQNWTELSWEGDCLSSVPRLRVAVATAPPAGVSCCLESGRSTRVTM